MRSRNHYKFTKKRHSKRGMFACLLAAASIFALIYMILVSFWQKGNAGIYLGSAGILALMAALAAFVESIKSIREEDTFRRLPTISVLFSILASGAWIAVYAIGFLL